MRGDRQRCEKCGQYVSLLDELADHYEENCPEVDTQ